MALFIILISVYLIVELTLYWLYLKKNGRREKMTLKNLYKLMEVRVLNRTLQNRISSEQAAKYEYQQLFVRVELLDAKPWMACLFAADECITIGRSMENRISIRDDLLSRMHCKIVAQNNVLYLQDMGATNGTTIRRRFFRRISLMHSDIVELQDGDIICVGHYRMKLRTYYGRQIYT